MNYPITYRIYSLEFRNGKPPNERMIGFASAVMEHNKADRTVTISKLGTPKGKVLDLVERFEASEVWSLRYEIAAGHFPPIPFCHPFPKGTGVRMAAHETDSGSLELILSRDGGQKFFFDNFTLSGVSQDKIDSQQRVFQFDE